MLPLLGAIPDSAMIVASGLGDRASADSQIAVGMGFVGFRILRYIVISWYFSFFCSTLAGSTIMLLTIPWFGGLILGRVDIVGKVGRDGRCSKFTLPSLWKQVNIYYSLHHNKWNYHHCINCTGSNRHS